MTKINDKYHDILIDIWIKDYDHYLTDKKLSILLNCESIEN